MRLKYHTGLTPERWQSFGWTRQVFMIASELIRAGSWLEKSDIEEAKRSYERAMALLYLTIGLQSDKSRQPEILRFYEALAGLYAAESPGVEENALLIKTLIMLDPSSYNLLIKV